MPVDTDALLFTYVVASADMRYIERSEREIHLRHVDEKGPVVRGEMSDCGPLCHANLGQILLEYAMSCEGTRDDAVEAEMARGFGQRLGKSLAKRLDGRGGTADGPAELAAALQCVLHSLEVPFTAHASDGEMRYQLEYDPVTAAAQEAGIRRGQPVARQALLALLETLPPAMDPGWQFVRDGASHDEPLQAISVVRVG